MAAWVCLEQVAFGISTTDSAATKTTLEAAIASGALLHALQASDTAVTSVAPAGSVVVVHVRTPAALTAQAAAAAGPQLTVGALAGVVVGSAALGGVAVVRASRRPHLPAH